MIHVNIMTVKMNTTSSVKFNSFVFTFSYRNKQSIEKLQKAALLSVSTPEKKSEPFVLTFNQG